MRLNPPLAEWRPAVALSRLDDIAIAGVATTRMAFSLDTTTVEVCLEAARGALADAGMDVSEVDGIAAAWPGPGGTQMDPGSPDWANLLGIQLRWIDDSYPGGVPAALNAAAAIRSGLCQTVLVFGGQAGSHSTRGGVVEYTRPDNEFVAPFGSSTPAQFALSAQHYLHTYGVERAQIAAVAATVRNMGSRNPAAVLAGKGPYDASDVLAARPIVDPFTLLDLCLTNDGAAAMVITATERARHCPQPPIRLLGGGCEWVRQQYVEPPRWEEVGRVGADAAVRAFRMAGIGPHDADVLSLYDPTSFEIVRQFEVLGLCGPGEGADYAAEVGIDVDGGMPTNTDGGLLSFSHCDWGGVTTKIIEIVRQLRGEAYGRQVHSAEVGVATGAGSGAQYHNVLVLGVDR